MLFTRALTFWLPMLPGLWLAKREINQAKGFLSTKNKSGI
jgi:hypothetical protein